MACFHSRGCRVAAWSLLARIYLNAQVYTGTAKNTEAITYAKKVIAASYQLTSTPVNGYKGYEQLFLADNNKQTNEIIFFYFIFIHHFAHLFAS